jgi:hypothetical protein
MASSSVFSFPFVGDGLPFLLLGRDRGGLVVACGVALGFGLALLLLHLL